MGNEHQDCRRLIAQGDAAALLFVLQFRSRKGFAGGGMGNHTNLQLSLRETLRGASYDGNLMAKSRVSSCLVYTSLYNI